MNSSRVASFSNAPLKSEVVVTEFCFCTPRIIMHMCWASMTTATPRGLSVFLYTVFYVICQSLLHLKSSGKGFNHPGNFTQPGDVPVRDIGYVCVAYKRKHVVFA